MVGLACNESSFYRFLGFDAFQFNFAALYAGRFVESLDAELDVEVVGFEVPSEKDIQSLAK